jgi:hypothetical protein
VKTKYILITFAVLLALVFIAGDAQAQCAMCKKVADDASTADNGNVAKNVNSAILYLMAVPYFALAFIFRRQLWGLYHSWRGKSQPQE